MKFEVTEAEIARMVLDTMFPDTEKAVAAIVFLGYYLVTSRALKTTTEENKITMIEEMCDMMKRAVKELDNSAGQMSGQSPQEKPGNTNKPH